MKRLLIALPLLAACGTPAYLPDGGRPRQVCETTFTTVTVKVQDLTGVAVPDAEVSAKNLSRGTGLTAKTNGSGLTYDVNEDLGSGQIELSAEAGSLKTAHPFVIQLTCGECDCTAMPASAILTVQ